MPRTVTLHQLPATNYKAYLFALIFIAGNILLPQLVHIIPNGGLIFLPIYFFTLIAAYKYGIYAGILTALCSPLANHLLFGMPPTGMLPIIIIKSVLLSVAASFAALYFNKVSIPVLLFTVFSYQFSGTLIEWVMVRDFSIAVSDFSTGFPGMLLQVLGGYIILKAIARY